MHSGIPDGLARTWLQWSAPTHMIGYTYWKYPLQEKRRFDSQAFAFSRLDYEGFTGGTVQPGDAGASFPFMSAGQLIGSRIGGIIWDKPLDAEN